MENGKLRKGIIRMMGAEQKRKTELWIAICLLVICVCMPILSLAEQITYEGPGWETPEDAVLFYLEGLKEQDIEKMISAYTVETCIDQFDMKAQLQRVRAYTTTMTPNMPNANKLVRAINIESRKSEIVRSILWQMLSICPIELDVSQPITFKEETVIEETSAFVDGLQSAFNSVDLSKLSPLVFVPPELISDLYMLDRNQQNIKAQASPYGVDEARSVVAVFTIENKICVLCCDAARYGDRWFMFKPGGNIAQLMGFSSLSGGMAVITEEDVAVIMNGLGSDERKALEEILSGIALFE